MRSIFTVILTMALAGCVSKPSLDDAKLSSRSLNLEVFFAGKTTAHGQFQDLFGNVSRRFAVDIDGNWDGETLTLVEDFIYEDQSTERRTWRLTKTGEDSWSGTAPGVIGTALGQESGDTFNWKYTIDLPVSDGTRRVSFDDWMWLLSDDRLLNRAYMSKYGITVGEVVIVFEKP